MSDRILEFNRFDGRHYYTDLEVYSSTDAVGASCIASEIHVCLDDIEKGLFIELCGYVADAGGEHASDPRDPRGDAFFLQPIGFFKVADRKELEQCYEVCLKGKKVIVSIDGELVVLKKINALCSQYLASDMQEGIYCIIDELYSQLLHKYRFVIELDDGGNANPEMVDATIAKEMGISLDLLNRARSFMAEAHEEDADGDLLETLLPDELVQDVSDDNELDDE